jgi:hypothetical protein
MAPDLREKCDDLVALALETPGPQARLKANEGLRSKWDGVRVTAAKVLTAWGDDESVDRVREALVDVAQHPVRWSTTGALARLLVPHLKETDLEWVLDVFVHKSHADNRFVVQILFEAFNPHRVLSQISSEGPGDKYLARDLEAAVLRAKARIKNGEG